MRSFLKHFAFPLICAFMLIFVMGTSRANAAKMTFSPGWGSFGAECEVSVNVLLNTEGEDTRATDLSLYYNTQEVEIVDQEPLLPGIQIRDGELYDAYVPSKVDEERGRIQSTAFNMGLPYNSGQTADVYATIVFRSKPGADATSFTFDFVPENTQDSNVVGMNNQDLLTQVVHASYAFDGDYCGDTTPPRVTRRQPANEQLNVPIDTRIRFRIVDGESGVDLSSVRIQVGDTEYDSSSPEVTYSGDPLEFYFTVDPVRNFREGEPVIIVIDAMDQEGNAMTSDTYAFNYLEDQVVESCGNKIVEEGEACEPPGTIACSEDCQIVPPQVRSAAPQEPDNLRLLLIALLILIVVSASALMFRSTLRD